MFVKFANADVLQAEIAQQGGGLMKSAHRHAFAYEPREGYLYVRSRAISSRTNDNFDTFPAEEIKKAWATFIGKPVFVNHHNDDHRRARGVIIDAALHEDTAPDGTPDTWIEVLMEIDAINFPKLAAAILAGDIERTSMGCDVRYSVCSVCSNKASTPSEYCKHIPRLKGKRIRRRTASGSGTEDVLVHEVCHGLSFFENSVLVEPPADPTAHFLGVDTRGVASLSQTATLRSQASVTAARASRGFPCDVGSANLGRKALAMYRRFANQTATVDDILLLAARNGSVGSQWAIEGLWGSGWENDGALDYAYAEELVKVWVEKICGPDPSDEEIWDELEDNLGEVMVILIGDTKAKYVDMEWDADIGSGSKIKLSEVRYNAGWGWVTLPANGRTVTAASDSPLQSVYSKASTDDSPSISQERLMVTASRKKAAMQINDSEHRNSTTGFITLRAEVDIPEANESNDLPIKVTVEASEYRTKAWTVRVVYGPHYAQDARGSYYSSQIIGDFVGSKSDAKAHIRRELKRAMAEWRQGGMQRQAAGSTTKCVQGCGRNADGIYVDDSPGGFGSAYCSTCVAEWERKGWGNWEKIKDLKSEARIKTAKEIDSAWYERGREDAEANLPSVFDHGDVPYDASPEDRQRAEDSYFLGYRDFDMNRNASKTAASNSYVIVSGLATSEKNWEVHRAGCKDLSSPKYRVSTQLDTVQAESAEEAIAELLSYLADQGWTEDDFRVLPCAGGKSKSNSNAGKVQCPAGMEKVKFDRSNFTPNCYLCGIHVKQTRNGTYVKHWAGPKLNEPNCPRTGQTVEANEVNCLECNTRVDLRKGDQMPPHKMSGTKTSSAIGSSFKTAMDLNYGPTTPSRDAGTRWEGVPTDRTGYSVSVLWPGDEVMIVSAIVKDYDRAVEWADMARAAGAISVHILDNASGMTATGSITARSECARCHERKTLPGIAPLCQECLDAIDSGEPMYDDERRTASRRLAYGEVTAPMAIDTLRVRDCPVCGEDETQDSDGRCRVCGYLPPPEPFRDPDLEVAQKADMRTGPINPDLLKSPSFTPPSNPVESSLSPVKEQSTSQGDSDMRPTIAVVARQKQIIQSQATRIAQLERALRRLADANNPAQPVTEPGSESPAATTEQTRAADTTIQVTQPGGIMAAPDAMATVDLTQPGGVAQAPNAISQTVTAPVNGYEQSVADMRTEVDVNTAGETIGENYITGDWANTTASKRDQARTFASLRLARLRLEAGIESGDDIAIAQKIAASKSPDAAIRAEIDALSKVQRTAGRRPGIRQQAVRNVPSLVSTASPVVAVPAPSMTPNDDEFLFT